MNYRHFKYEGWLYALAFLLAIAVSHGSSFWFRLLKKLTSPSTSSSSSSSSG